MTGCRVSCCKYTESVMAIRIEKLSGDRTVLSLSPGERAGVRASVNFHSTKNVEKAVWEYWGFQHPSTPTLHYSTTPSPQFNKARLDKSRLRSTALPASNRLVES
jgi:hypothetical protein